MILELRGLAAFGLAVLGAAATAAAQPAPVPYHEVDLDVDSGWVENTTVDGPAIVYSEQIHVPDAQWLRLYFSDLHLSGNVEEPDHTILRITSHWDGAVHYLNALTAEQWYWSSAYMNGDTLTVEIIAYPDTGPSRIVVGAADVGEPFGAGDVTSSICGATDDRVLSDDPRSARHMPIGCSAWIIDDTNHCFLTAGHCSTGGSDVMQFNVPLSNDNGSVVNPPPEDQYSVDQESVQQVNGGIGNDWGYFGCFPNSNTNLTPFEAQGAYYTVADEAPPVEGQTIRITGYGTVSFPVPPSWNQAQKTHTGPYFTKFGTTLQYQVDTSGGNSGSAVENEDTGEAIGIHTHAGCSGTSGNQGTDVANGGLQNALDNPQGVCDGGDTDEPVKSSIYLATDSAGNFGTVDFEQGDFGNLATLSHDIQGLAFDPNSRTFYASTDDARLLAMNDDASEVAEIGALSGVISDKLYGLAFDKNHNVLYGIDQTDGQLYSVDPLTAQATPIGAPGGGELGALAFNTDNDTLYAIDDTGNSSKLRAIDPATGEHEQIKNFGFGLKDFDGMAYDEDAGRLWAISDVTDLPVQINPDNGSLTLGFPGFGAPVGPFYGLAFAAPPCPADFNADGAANILDFIAFQAAFQAGDDAADANGDGSLDILDFTAFQEIFEQGCA